MPHMKPMNWTLVILITTTTIITMITMMYFTMTPWSKKLMKKISEQKTYNKW